jgi:hypothetical protein
LRLYHKKHYICRNSKTREMKNLFKSLAAFQQEVEVIHKGSQGYGYSYADLPAIFEKINPLLKKHGLGFTQLIEGQDLKTIVFHSESGEVLESQTTIPVVALKGMNDYQSFGSGVTYYRRYALSAMLGLVTDKDTDASGEQTKPQAPAKPQAKKTFQDGGYENAIEAVLAGKVTAAKVKSSYELTDAQRKQLEEAEKIYKSNNK